MKRSWLIFFALFIVVCLSWNLSYAQEREKAVLDAISERIEFQGELEAGFKVDSIGYRGASRTDSSEFDLITAALAIEAQVTDWINVTVVPLFEIDDFFIDEAHVTIGPTDRIPFYISGGIHYYPFGRREAYTHFPDDPFVNLPITLYFGELQDPGFILGFTHEIPGMTGHSFTVEGYVYKPWMYACGPYEDIKRTSHADSFGFDVHYNVETDDYTFEIGGSWTSNIFASSGIKDFASGLKEGIEGEPLLALVNLPVEIYMDSKVDAIAAYMSGTYKNFYFTAEYMQSLEPLRHIYGQAEDVYSEEISPPDVDGHYAHPHLWTFEIGANIEEYLALPTPVELMFRYAGCLEAQPIYDIPRNRWAVGLNIGIHDYATWSLAYAYNDYDPDWDEVYGEESGRSNRHLFFTQIAIEF